MEVLAPVLNQMIPSCPISISEENLLQRFLDVYQNMEHYAAPTSGIIGSEGLWFTYDRDKGIDSEKKLFCLTFGNDENIK